MRKWGCLAVVVVALFAAVPARGEDSDQRRYYLDLRYGESNPISNAHDVVGASLGLNVGRYLGFELAMDWFQLRMQPPSGRVGDLTVRSFTPQMRLRYPLFDDRLVPYVFGGMGVSLTQVNDTTTQVVWSSGNTDTRAVTTLGLGLEYFLRDNIAFGVEGKYFILGSGSFTAHGAETEMGLNTGTMTFGFRLFYPELHPSEPGTPPRGRNWWRFYGALRTGGALSVHKQIFPGVSTTPGQQILGSRFTMMFGAALGLDLGDYFGVEASFENYVLKLSLPGTGPIGKYSIFPILLQPRLRYPLLDGRLEPYLLGGIGAELAEPDKPNDNAMGVLVSGRDVGLAGSLGAGIQYYVMDDIGINAELKYVFSRGLDFQIDGQPEVSGNNDALLLSIGLRAYLFDF